MKTKNGRVDMLQGSLPINILRFALPVMLSGLLQLTFNAADIIVVGRCAGDTALAAVTSSAPLINLLINTFVGLSMGTNVVVAQALGRKNEEYVERTVHACVLLSILVGMGIGVMGFLGTPVFLRLMDTPASVMGEAVLYLRIYFLGVPAMTLYNFGSAILRGSGDTRRPMNILILCGVFNLVLNLMFVLGFDMGVDGVAWATAIANVLSCVLVLRCLMGENDCRHLDLRRLRVDWDVLKQVVRIGIPASLQAVLMSVSNVVIQSSVNSFGDVVVTASGAAGNLGTYINSVCSAFGSTCVILAANRLDRVKRGQRLCMGMSMGCAALLGLRLLWVFLVFPMFPTHAVIVFCFPVGWAVTGVVQQIRLHWILRRLSAKQGQAVA